MEQLKEQPAVPFVSSYALQCYSLPEVGIIEAAINGYQHWYIDGSLASEAPKNGA